MYGKQCPFLLKNLWLTTSSSSFPVREEGGGKGGEEERERDGKRERNRERAKEGLHLDPPVKKSGAADPLRRLGEQLRRLLLLLRR